MRAPAPTTRRMGRAPPFQWSRPIYLHPLVWSVIRGEVGKLVEDMLRMPRNQSASSVRAFCHRRLRLLAAALCSLTDDESIDLVNVVDTFLDQMDLLCAYLVRVVRGRVN